VNRVAVPIIAAGLVLAGCGSTGTFIPTPTQSTDSGAATVAATPTPDATPLPAAFQGQVCAAIADGREGKWQGAQYAWLAAESAAGSVDLSLVTGFLAASEAAGALSIDQLSNLSTASDLPVYQRAVAALPSDVTASCAP
jgi:hypothetical protein